MTLINPYVKHLKEDNLYKKVELAGRTCYKSNISMTDATHERFVKSLVDRGHYSVLEHADFSVEFGSNTAEGAKFVKEKIESCIPQRIRSYFTTYNNIVHANVRAWREFLEFSWIGEIIDMFPIFFGGIKKEYWIDCPVRLRSKEEDIELQDPSLLRETFIIETSRDISHQLVRHRVFSFSQESQRYCNYFLDRFSRNVNFVMPDFVENGSKKIQKLWIKAREKDEEEYFKYLAMGIKPENARNCLPNATATTIVVSGSLWGWHHFFELRLDKTAQKEIRDIAGRVKDLLVEKYGDTLLGAYIGWTN